MEWKGPFGEASSCIWQQGIRVPRKDEEEGEDGVTKWEGVVVGYPSSSVGYRVWDPVWEIQQHICILMKC